MTKSELRHARKAAQASGQPLVGDLALPGQIRPPVPVRSRRRVPRERYASREEQYGRYLDCGPQNWDDQ
jgi:hypothetical protein